METYQVFSLLGVIISGVALLLSVKQTRDKLSVRSHLIRRLAKDYQFLEEVKKLEESRGNEAKYLDEINRLQAIIATRIKELNEIDRVQVEAPLRQSSPVGRSRYIERIARDVELELKHAA